MQNGTVGAGKRPGNPLNKRVWKDLLSDWKRYLMIFLMLVVTIGFVSGMYVANNSMMTTLDNNVEELRREDGHFELSAKADSALLAELERGEKADMVTVFRDRAYSEAEEKVTDAVNEAIEENVREQVKSVITSQVTAAVEEQLAGYAALGAEVTDEQREAAMSEAVETAMSENYESAVEEALKAAYESEDYKTALSDAMKEAKEEIDKEINEKYDELAERYELDKSFEPVPVKIHELFFREQDEIIPGNVSYSGRIRVYSERKDFDLYDILEGRKPENENEIIIDRMHADNVKLKTGDTIKAGNAEYTIVGLAAFVDYSTLYESNTDTMFDALTFDVAMVTDAGFERMNAPLHANYAFEYVNKPADVIAEKALSDNFLKVLITQTAVAEDETEIKDYVPAYANHAITFAPTDMGSDESMGGVLLYILVAVLAFIFAVTASAKLEKESSVIGTLRASGFTKGELLRYYMSGPLLVVLFAAIVGNILGYTALKHVVTAMYYNSYSLPTYETVWTSDAFVRTTLIPIVLMLVINFIVITRMLRLSPLRFLRHDLKKTRRKKAVRLPKWKFFARFRMRVFLQNIPNYIMMFVGVSFVMLLLSMAVGMPETLKYYQSSMADMMFANEQVMLMTTKDDDGELIETSVPGAEKFSAASLIRKSDILDEEVTVYGIVGDSAYIKLDDAPDGVYISKAFAEKYNVSAGDTITLSEKYENKEYIWKVCGIYDYSAAIAVFMPNDMFNAEFDRKDGDFSGYMSDVHIDDIDEKYIAKTITADDMMKIAAQLDHSMGAYMVYFQYVCVIVAAIILYLLTKIIIEKNERSISMVKILGYNSGEIASLYLVTTAIVVFVTEFAAIFIGYKAMELVWKVILMKLGGYFGFIIPFSGFVKEFVLVFAAYMIITLIDFIRIKRIPKVLALKNVE
ncbi:MAG: permease [Ruminiclostridium sp.]|nr:permease [Ruminiclostridium sp.]